MRKLSFLCGSEWVEYRHPPRFLTPREGRGSRRVVAGACANRPAVFERLVDLLTPPYLLLYVLHTPRGESEAGRYQSPEVSKERFHSLVGRYRNFLEGDGRFDFWVHSPADKATVVWDRHDQLFTYGPIEEFVSVLRGLGYSPGPVDIPSPHQHHYRPEFDPDSRRLLEEFEWGFSPLREEDIQFRG